MVVSKNKKGFILYIVCVIAIALFFSILGLSRFKSGAVLQLSKTLTQERMIAVARASIIESLANVKANINNKGSDVGGAVYNLWKNSSPATESSPAQIWSATFSGSSIPTSTQMATEYLGSNGKVTAEVSLQATKQIKSSGNNSYLGFLRIVGKVSCDGIAEAVKITEQHDVKITDLSYPFLDKYALFVKSFCKNINTNDKKFIIQGVKGAGEGASSNYSFVYFGNRNYPVGECPECQANPASHPQVILDLDFSTENNNDRVLLGAFFQQNATFNILEKADYERDVLNNDKIDGKFFYTFQKEFKDYGSSFINPNDYCKVSEMVGQHNAYMQKIVESGGMNSQASLVWHMAYDYINGGSNPLTSTFYKQMIEQAYPIWKYYYGYTDYNTIYPKNENSFGLKSPFTGLVPYFMYAKNNNKYKRAGGAMPTIYGADRKTPVYVDGPVYVRFFKVGFIDKVYFNIPIDSYSAQLSFPYFPCRWEQTQETFFGKVVNPKFDAMTKQFMSHPVDWLSINNFYYGAGENKPNKDNILSGGTIGYNVFHYLNNRLVSTLYTSVEEFKKERIKNIDGENILDLDGICVISDGNKTNLDLTDISKYRGKGMIVYELGNCKLGNLSKKNDEDYLKIYLECGRFFIESNAEIWASLIATTKTNDNASTPRESEGGLFTNKNRTVIHGNVIIDNLFDMTDKADFTIIHDSKLYKNDYPVRVSLGNPKTLYVLNYNGKD